MRDKARDELIEKKGNETKSDRKRWRKTNKKKKSEECVTYAPLEIQRHDLAEYGRDSDSNVL